MMRLGLAPLTSMKVGLFIAIEPDQAWAMIQSPDKLKTRADNLSWSHLVKTMAYEYIS